jgi:hypothetical protein
MRLILAAVAFAILWTGAMLWWEAPLDLPKVLILMIAGTLAGVLWYVFYGMWYRRFVGRNLERRC